MDRHEIGNDEGHGSEQGGTRKRQHEDEEERESGPDEAPYPPPTDEPHVAGAREPVDRSAVEPESSRLEDRSRMREIMKRVNDALHGVRPRREE